MRKKIIIIATIILILTSIGFGVYFYLRRPIKIEKDYSKIKLERASNLMIVAHPDDDTIWGGVHILSGNYLVVCVTCGTNKTRADEFTLVMEKSDNQFIMLGYPDKVGGERSDWKEEKDDIKRDIEDIMSLKKWDHIVTHNPDGEYGHEHHKMTSKIVTDVYNELGKTESLYYFGKYYTKGNLAKLEEKPIEVDPMLYERKLELIDLYVSQKFIKTMFDHMFPYENWTEYKKD